MSLTAEVVSLSGFLTTVRQPPSPSYVAVVVGNLEVFGLEVPEDKGRMGEDTRIGVLKGRIR